MEASSHISSTVLNALNLETKVNKVREYIYCVSHDGLFLYLNQPCADFLKINADEAIGQPVNEFAPQALLDAGGENNAYVEHQNFHLSELCYDQHWYRFIKIKIHLENHESAVITIVKDITEEKSRQLKELKNTYSVNAELIDSQNILAQIDLDISLLTAPYSIMLCDLAQLQKNNHTFGEKIINTHIEQIKHLMYTCLAGREYWVHLIDGCFVLIINNATEGEIFFLRDYIEKEFKDNQLLSEELHANFGIAHVTNNSETFAKAVDSANRQLYLDKYQNKIDLALNDHIIDFEIDKTRQKNKVEITPPTMAHLSETEKNILMETIFHASSNAFALLKPDATILAVNDALCQVSGYTEEELIGQSISIAIPDFKDEHPYYACYQEVREKGFWEGEMSVQGKNKQIYFIKNRLQGIYNEQGELIYVVTIAQDFTDIKNKQAEIQQIAYYDNLTNLPNKHCFNQMLSEKILATSPKENFALLFIDVDNFQDINDMYGYSMGDATLKGIAIRLDLFFGKNALLSRISGDLFVAIINNISRKNIHYCLDRLEASFSKELPLNYNHNAPIRITTGVSFFPEDGRTTETLINKANIAVHNAKKYNKGHYAIFDKEMMLISQKTLEIKQSIIDGLKFNYFSLFYQPKISLQDGKISGYDVYLKLKTPENKEILPETFIPIAEKLGLINQLNEWVIREVSVKGAKLYTEDKLKGKITISLSTTQLQDNDFVDSLVDTFRFSDLPIHYIRFDIKGDITNREQTIAISNIERLDKMGIALSLDSYDIKLSDFNALAKLPIKRIRLNEKFTSQLDRNINALAITKSICTLANTLNIGIIAAGVENINQAEILKELGCIEAQGIYYASPLPFDNL